MLNLEALFESSKEDFEPPYQCIDGATIKTDIGDVYVIFTPGKNYITLDGEFTVAQLEEIIAFLRAHPPTTP